MAAALFSLVPRKVAKRRVTSWFNSKPPRLFRDSQWCGADVCYFIENNNITINNLGTPFDGPR